MSKCEFYIIKKRDVLYPKCTKYSKSHKEEAQYTIPQNTFNDVRKTSLKTLDDTLKQSHLSR